MNENSTTVILLRGKENYNNWLINITAILEMKELDNYMSGPGATRPVDLVVADEITKEQAQRHKEEQKVWDKKSKVA